MKKTNKKQILTYIIAFIICFFVTGIIGISATSSITSREVSYKNNTSGMDSTNVQDAIDELYINNCKTTPTTSLEIGDYVKIIPTISSYETETKYTGYNTTQTINPQELKLWRVIRKNENGTVDLVSEYTSSVNINFSGVVGYQNLVGYLNIIASKYENRKYTVGSRIMGYDNQTEFITNTSNFDGSKNEVPWTYTTTSGSSSYEVLGQGDLLYQTDYNLVKAAYGNANDSAKANMVETSTVTNYWLGSRYYYSSTNEANFYGRYVNTSGVNTNDRLRRYYYNYWYQYSPGYAIRPIIVLKAGVSVEGTGAGTLADPYILQ